MNIQVVDPTEITGWDQSLIQTGEIDFFHSSMWARVLMESYGYRPLYMTSSKNGSLSLSLPLMEVRSGWAGNRGVSLPFADQCIPFYLDRTALLEAVDMCIDHGKRAGWRYVEWRAARYHDDSTPFWSEYFSHEIALAGDDAELFARLIPSNRRNIRKAIKVGLSVKIGASWDAVNEFCRLNSVTRKRHGLPPQPRRFFEKIFEHVLSSGHGFVVSARHDEKVVASAVFFHFGKRALFKYGASESDFHHLRPNNLIMWEAIRWFRAHGFATLSLGRTEMDNPGLLRYKRAWGAEERRFGYYRYDLRTNMYLVHKPGRTWYRNILSRTPNRILRGIGGLIYRHMG